MGSTSYLCTYVGFLEITYYSEICPMGACSRGRAYLQKIISGGYLLEGEAYLEVRAYSRIYGLFVVKLVIKSLHYVSVFSRYPVNI